MSKSDYDGSKGMINLILENHDPLYRFHPDVDPDELDEDFERMLRDLLKRHARELAEKIRREAHNPDALYPYAVVGGLNLAATLIDPKVSSE